jgi:hypothetical protein
MTARVRSTPGRWRVRHGKAHRLIAHGRRCVRESTPLGPERPWATGKPWEESKGNEGHGQDDTQQTVKKPCANMICKRQKRCFLAFSRALFPAPLFPSASRLRLTTAPAPRCLRLTIPCAVLCSADRRWGPKLVHRTSVRQGDPPTAGFLGSTRRTSLDTTVQAQPCRCLGPGTRA